jgi:hypothetical protein
MMLSGLRVEPIQRVEEQTVKGLRTAPGSQYTHCRIYQAFESCESLGISDSDNDIIFFACSRLIFN